MMTTAIQDAASASTDIPGPPRASPSPGNEKLSGVYRAVFACASYPSAAPTEPAVPRKGSGNSRAGGSEVGDRAPDGR